MIQKFISLQWKEFIRSASFQKGVAIKVLLFIAAAYIGFMAVGAGLLLFFGIRKYLRGMGVPEGLINPHAIVNSFILFWFFADLILRYFLQQMPVLNIKPLMIIPIKQKTVIIPNKASKQCKCGPEET